MLLCPEKEPCRRKVGLIRKIQGGINISLFEKYEEKLHPFERDSKQKTCTRDKWREITQNCSLQFGLNPPALSADVTDVL